MCMPFTAPLFLACLVSRKRFMNRDQTVKRNRKYRSVHDVLLPEMKHCSHERKTWATDMPACVFQSHTPQVLY